MPKRELLTPSSISENFLSLLESEVDSWRLFIVLTFSFVSESCYIIYLISMPFSFYSSGVMLWLLIFLDVFLTFLVYFTSASNISLSTIGELLSTPKWSPYLSALLWSSLNSSKFGFSVSNGNMSGLTPCLLYFYFILFIIRYNV